MPARGLFRRRTQPQQRRLFPPPSVAAPTQNIEFSGSQTITRVQEVGTFSDGDATTTKNIPVSAAPDGSNKLILILLVAGNRTFTVTDTKGNTWDEVSRTNGGTALSSAIWYTEQDIDALTTSDTIDVVISAGTGLGAKVYEYSGGNNGTFFDVQSAAGDGNSGVTTFNSGASTTPEQSTGHILAVACFSSGPGTITRDAPLDDATLVSSAWGPTDFLRQAFVYEETQVDQTAQTFSGTYVNARQNTAHVVIWKNAVGAGGRIDQPATPFAPTVSNLNTISLGLINQTAVPFTPTVSPQQFITLGRIDSTRAIFAPSISPVNVGLLQIGRATGSETTIFADPFNGTSLSGDWAEDQFNDIPITVGGGNITFTFAVGTSYSEIRTVVEYDLTDRISALEIAQLDDDMYIGIQAAPDGSAVGPSTFVALGLDGEHYVSGFTGTSFVEERAIGPTPPTKLFIRESAGTYFYGYVLGGTAVEWSSRAAPSSPTAQTVLIYAGWYSAPPVVGAVASASHFSLTHPDATFSPTVSATYSISLGLIDQTAAAFQPTVSTAAGEQTISLGLINQAADTFNPTVTPGAAPVSVGLINQAAATFTPTVTSVANISAGFVNQAAVAFGPTVSNLNTIALGLINQSAATFNPTVTAGAVNISLALIDRSATAHAPTVTSLATISLALIDRSAATFTPTVSATYAISLGLIDRSAATFAPTVSAGAAALSVGLIDQTAATFTPTVSTTANILLALLDRTATASAPTVSGLNTISLGLISQVAATFEPTVTTAAVIVLALLDQTATASTPTVTSLATVNLGQIDQTAAAFTPSVSAGGALIELDRIDQTAAPFAPTTTSVATVALGLLDQTATAHAPEVFVDQEIQLGLISQPAQAFAPTTTDIQEVVLGLIDRTAATFNPTVTPGLVVVFLDLLSQAAQAHAPTVNTTADISLGLLDRTAEAHQPSVSTFSNIELGRIDATATAFEPTVATAGAQALEFELIDQTASAFAPSVAGGARRGRGGHFGPGRPRIIVGPKPLPGDQFVDLVVIAVNAKAFAPTVEVSDDEVLLGLSDEDLLVLV